VTTPSHPPAATGQVLREQLELLSAQIEALNAAVRQLQNVVRSEQEHTRRVLLMHFGSADLVNERGT